MFKSKSGLWLDKRIPNHPYCDAGILFGKPGSNMIEALFSYKTCAGMLFTGKGMEDKYKDDNTYLCITSLYSKTTCRHISYWLREHRIPYSIAKVCGTKNLIYCLDTKEYMEP